MDLKTAQKMNFDGFERPIILWDSRLWFLLKIDLELEVFVLAPTRNSNNVQLAKISDCEIATDAIEPVLKQCIRLIEENLSVISSKEVRITLRDRKSNSHDRPRFEYQWSQPNE